MNIKRVATARVNLMLHGFTKGVSIGWIGKSNNRVFPDSQSFLSTSYSEAEILKLTNDGLAAWVEESSAEKNTVARENWNAESNLCIVLYCLILLKKYTKVVETGVANGVTTRVIMRALEQTGGVLHSFDISETSRNVYKGNGNWHFHKLEANRKIQKQLRKQIQGIGKCDLWLHDSNHGQTWQEFEYLLAWENLEKNGVLCSDDVDASPAWGQASKVYLKKPAVIYDSRKFIGISFKS